VAALAPPALKDFPAVVSLGAGTVSVSSFARTSITPLKALLGLNRNYGGGKDSIHERCASRLADNEGAESEGQGIDGRGAAVEGERFLSAVHVCDHKISPKIKFV